MIQQKMFGERKSNELLHLAQDYAIEYLRQVNERDVYPGKEDLAALVRFEESLPTHSGDAKKVLNMLYQYGTAATVAQMGGRYFGFVNGGALPVTIGVKWLADVWDQCGALYFTSPVNAKLEIICERWLKELFDLPQISVAGFVSGTSMANLAALAAARFYLLKKMGWNIHQDGLNGSPRIRILAHEQVHASVKRTLALLGFGVNNVESIPADAQGRIDVSQLPLIDDRCLIILQAGNANTGGFDDFETVCNIANDAGAWVHIDGAFGLWAAASRSLKHLTKGMNKADSWAVDGHKTLNTPYDSGIVLCKHPGALVQALQATDAYLSMSGQREPLFYTPEMSKRSRAIELWAALKYLGTDGIDQMVTNFHSLAKRFAKGLEEVGFTVLNDVVFNQVLVRAPASESTVQILKHVQASGICWMSGTTWEGLPAIRLSVCSWVTTEADIDRSVQAFAQALLEYDA